MRGRPRAPVSQPAEEVALKAIQCGFDPHRGHMTHEHEHDHDYDLETMYTQETWDARYAESERIWSGRPNQRLVEEVRRPVARAGARRRLR